MVQVNDFLPRLDQAIREARSLGHANAADRLEIIRHSAFTTSSEMLGELGAAIRRFQTEIGSDTPGTLQENLHYCLQEIRKVWPRV